MDRFFKWIFRKCLLPLLVPPHRNRDLIVWIRLSVSAFCLKYLVFISVCFLFRTFAILSSTVSYSVKLPWLSTLMISVAMYNSQFNKLLIIETVISHLNHMGHWVTHRQLTNSEWWIAEAKLESSMAGEMNASLAVTYAEYLSF